MKIGEQKIEEIRAANDIVDVIGEHISLKQRGKNFIGLCPFHAEKTPSFNVNKEMQIYHCFGCHKGGNVFKFLMEYKNISFIEALKELAEKANISLSFDSRESEKSEFDIYYGINEIASAFFINNLHNSDNGKVARDYLIKRNIKLQTQRVFSLGYSLDEWHSLLNYLKEKGIEISPVEKLGLIRKSESGNYYDAFRGRIIFPIFSHNGKVIAFGGRILKESNDFKEGKYINSSESPVYIKRRALYGLFQNKDEIRRLNKCLLVEGYLDLISLHQAGIRYAVAPCGTAFTEEQASVLSRYSKNITVLFDADEAGKRAALRSIEILAKKDFNIKIASLPEGEDPDSFVQKKGKEEFENLLKRGADFIEYQTEDYKSAGKLDDPVSASEAVREIVKSISFVPDPLKRASYINLISEKFKIRSSLLELELEKLFKAPAEQISNQIYIEKKKSGGENKPLEKKTSNNPYEIHIVKLLFYGDEDLLSYIFDRISLEDFADEECSYLAELVYDSFVNETSTAPSMLLEKIELDDLKNKIEQVLIGPAPGQKWEEMEDFAVDEKLLLFKEAAETVNRFKARLIDEKIFEYQERLEYTNDDSVSMQILSEIKTLQSEKNALLNDAQNFKTLKKLFEA